MERHLSTKVEHGPNGQITRTIIYKEGGVIKTRTERSQDIGRLPIVADNLASKHLTDPSGGSIPTAKIHPLSKD